MIDLQSYHILYSLILMYENWFLKNRMVLLYFICGQEILQKKWLLILSDFGSSDPDPDMTTPGSSFFFKIRIWVFNSVDYV